MTPETTVFIKLGGSFITEKDQPYTLAPARLEKALAQVKAFSRAYPNVRIVLGHGSGSFGHAAAKGLDLKAGLVDKKTRKGFQKVWFAAQDLHRQVIAAAQGQGLPVISFPASAGALSRNKHVYSWDLSPMRVALLQKYIPLVYGDTVMDMYEGGVILSTETQFAYLARCLLPSRIFLLGKEAGVFADFPARNRLIQKITPSESLLEAIGASETADVTGGMLAKVASMQALCKTIPGLQAHILSGDAPNGLVRCYEGEQLGTVISA